MSSFERITEQPGAYRHLEKLSIIELLQIINREDATVATSVQNAIPQIEKLVQVIVDHLHAGGRLFYIGAGTSGRLGIVDASECPPTFGVPYGLIIPLIAGGDKAITQAVENAEDNTGQGWKDLQKHFVSSKDVVIGLSASGATPYVLSAIATCRRNSITTGCIVCNPSSPIASVSDCPVELITGPEVVTGSTRMKAGTAQKLVLNMISTSVMVQLGRVEDNRMVDMQLTNAKLVERGVKMVMEQLRITDDELARKILLQAGSVREATKRSLK